MPDSHKPTINPLLDFSDLPKFDRIAAESVEPALDHVLQMNRDIISDLLQNEQSYTFSNVVEPMENIGHQLERIWAPVSHLNAVNNNEELRDAHNRSLEKLTSYWSEVGQNRLLYEAYRRIRDTSENLTPAQRRLLDLALINFELAGVSLPDDQRQQYTDIQLKLSALQSKFEENVLDCSNQWFHQITHANELGGLPDNVLSRAEAEAKSRDLDGWCFCLDFPTYNAVLSHAESSTLRKIFYDAWVTRASTAGKHDAKFDNTPIIDEILALRQAAAELLGYPDFAEFSLARKMADSGEQVESFLRDLAKRSGDSALREFNRLEKFAGKKLQPWDITFYAERYREENFKISDEALKPYFPLTKAISGVFKIAEHIFDISIKKVTVTNAWHADVEMYEVTDAEGHRAGRFYTDLFARPKKRGGAWMAECVGHNSIDGPNGNAVSFLVCNFMPAEESKPPLLTHDEIVTLFHEFGHTLHMLLSKVPYPGIAGINGVSWDAVELPSQFMENFAWQEETLPMISAHYETGEPMPSDLFKRLLGTRTFHAGLRSLRQLEFALFDIRIHREQKTGISYETVLDQVREELAVVPTTDYNHFANAFSHIFAGGYAAGYYSYKWAEVLSADAFSAFEESSILDQATGLRFRKSILEKGGAVKAIDAFKSFRGREPSVDALIRHNGLDNLS